MPARARQFARSLGLLAKTDRADAGALREMGLRLDLPETPPEREIVSRLKALRLRRRQLVDAAGDEKPLPFTKPEEIRNSAFAKVGLIGTPDQVNAKLEQFSKEFLCTDFIMDMQYPGLDPSKGTRSLELFAKEVMPNFR